ncbi:MAG: NVEALA domain-containing protein [Butyricimonas faecalis]
MGENKLIDKTMNKVKLMIAFMFCCAIGYVGFTTYGKVTMSEAEKFMLANVEALTDGESGVGSVVICRCHDDKRCYGGNNISFRPLCSKVTAGTGGDALDCSTANDVCQKLH